jgi:5-methylcytosine-specific restriction enzyme subunit McrC
LNERYILAYEHQTIRVAPAGTLPKEAYQAFLDRIPSLPSGTLTPEHNGLRTGSFCGLLQAGDWTLEILPKIYADEDERPSRGLLIKMLGVCFDLPLWQQGLAPADSGDDLLLILIRAFLDEAQRQARQGWIKSYVGTEERLTRPRGQIKIVDQVRRGRARAHQLDCDFDELTVDNAHNRVVNEALVIARPRMPLGSRLAAHADQIALSLADVATVPVTLTTIHTLPKTRLTARYERLLLFSEWIIRLLMPDVHVGEERGLSLLFDMNRLFQDYLAATLLNCAQRHPLQNRLTLTLERPVRALVVDQNDTSIFMLRPDLCLHLDGELICILDAKWKQLKPQDGNKAGVSQALVIRPAKTKCQGRR